MFKVTFRGIVIALTIIGASLFVLTSWSAIAGRSSPYSSIQFILPTAFSALAVIGCSLYKITAIAIRLRSRKYPPTKTERELLEQALTRWATQLFIGPLGAIAALMIASGE